MMEGWAEDDSEMEEWQDVGMRVKEGCEDMEMKRDER